MKSVRTPFARLHHVALAGLLAVAGASAMAQAPAVATPAAPMASTLAAGHAGEHMGRYDPAKMQAMMAKRQADMKTRLNITPAQEGAWTSFTAAMQPPANMGGRPTPEQRAEFAKLTTPERIDKMRAMRTQRMADMSAAMDKRGEATKTFYAALTPEQQKVFDTEHKKHGRHGGPSHHGAANPMKG
jgi:protein CpxP